MPLPETLLPDANAQLEWQLQHDMRERGRRLQAFKKATEGKELQEVAPGHWRYVTVHPTSA